MSSIRKRAYKGFDLNFNQVQGPGNSSSEYYEKLFNDPHVNKLIFFNDGPEYRFNINDLDDLGTIATTRHVIKRILHKPSNKELAVKLVHIPHNRHSTDDENLKKLKYLVREIQNFRELRNELHIVRFYGFCLHEGQALICMELMDLSLKELSLKFIKNGQKFSEELLSCIIVAVLKSLVACKLKNIIYRDVKPDTVLLSQDGAIKLCDFGESKILHDSLASTFAGSLSYWPPERFAHEKTKYDVRADIWSLGITLIELVTGSVPYRDRKGNIPNNIILLQNLIVNLDTNKTVEDSFEGYTEGTKDFVKSCLKKVEERPKYKDVMETKFYQFCETIDSQKTVRVILKKHYYQELPVEEMDTSETNDDTINENLMKILNNIKENLEELLAIDDQAQLKYKCDEMFQHFFELIISGQAQNPSILKLAEEQLKTLIFQCAGKFLYYLMDFTDFVIRTDGDGGELESMNICQTRSGIQCFIDMFGPMCFDENKELRELTQKDGFIEKLDEKIRNWKKNFYCLNKDQIDSYFFGEINSVKHWWWFADGHRPLVGKLFDQQAIEICKEKVIKQMGMYFKENNMIEATLISRHERSNTYIEVKSYFYKPWRSHIAVKIFPFSSNKDETRVKEKMKIENELENLRKVSNVSWIIQFYGYSINEKGARLYMGLMDCDLRQFYRWILENRHFPEDLLACIAVAIVNALIHCKSKHILHRDIKPTNILLNIKGEIKLCDFGSSVDITKFDNSSGGTYAYWAPELFDLNRIEQEEAAEIKQEAAEINQNEAVEINISKQQGKFKSEIWSIGIAICETAIGRLPYLTKGEQISNHKNVAYFETRILNISVDKILEEVCQPDYSIFRTFITACLLRFEKRADLDMLKKHPFCLVEERLKTSMNAYVSKYIKEMDKPSIMLEGVEYMEVGREDSNTEIYDEAIQKWKNIQQTYKISFPALENNENDNQYFRRVASSTEIHFDYLLESLRTTAYQFYNRLGCLLSEHGHLVFFKRETNSANITLFFNDVANLVNALKSVNFSLYSLPNPTTIIFAIFKHRESNVHLALNNLMNFTRVAKDIKSLDKSYDIAFTWIDRMDDFRTPSILSLDREDKIEKSGSKISDNDSSEDEDEKLYDELTASEEQKINYSNLRRHSGVDWIIIKSEHNNTFEYDENDILGSGSCAVVYKGKALTRTVAIKVIDLNRIYDKRKLIAYKNVKEEVYKELKEFREITGYIRTDENNHVIRLYDYAFQSPYIYLALQYCLGTLEDFLSEKINFSGQPKNVKPSLVDLLLGAAKGLNVLHQKNIMHRDITTKNILISKPDINGNSMSVLSDFGHCKELEKNIDKAVLSRNIGTKGWTSPEIVRWDRSNIEEKKKITIGTKTDIFSLGCVYAYALTFDIQHEKGQHPFGELEVRESNMESANFRYDLSTFKDVDETYNLIESMIQLEESKRPTTKAVLNHTFFWNNEERYKFLKVANGICRSDKISTETQRFRATLQHDSPYQDWIQIIQNKGVEWEPFYKFVTTPPILKKKKSKPYDGTLLTDLLRAIRNLEEHQDEHKDPALGPFTSFYCKKIFSAFPELIMYLYKKFFKIVILDHSWKTYSDEKQKLFNLMCKFYQAGKESEVFFS